MNWNYRDVKDSAIFLNGSFSFSSKTVTISAATVSGSNKKPNEDSFAIRKTKNCLWLAVFDGTTNLKDIANLKTSGARFSSHHLKKEFYISKLSSPKIVMLGLNKSLLNSSNKLGTKLADKHSLPASMGTIVKINLLDNCLSLAHAGDTYVIQYFKNGSSQIITDDRNAPFDDKIFSLIKKIAHQEKISNRRARENDWVSQALIEMYLARNNNPDGSGSGLINGDFHLGQYIQTTNLALDNIRALLIASDGLVIQGLPIDKMSSRSKIRQIINTGGMRSLIKTKKDSENNDQSWEYVRYKHSDDATGIYVEFAFQTS